MKICSRNSYKTYAATLIAAGILVGNMTTVLAFSPLEPFQKSETPTQRIEASEYTALSRASEALQRGQTMQAIPDLQATVEQNPVNVLGLFHLGNAYLDLAKQSEDPTQQANYLEMAQQAFERVVDLNDDLTLVYFKLGKIALMRNDSRSALRYYRIGLKTDPHNAALIFNMARVYDQLGDKSEAIRYYEQTISEDPSFTYAYNNLALMYEDNKDYEHAEKTYKRALKKDPSYNLARLNLGNMYASTENYKAAQETLMEAQVLEPNNEWIYYYLGNMYLRMDRYDSAVEAYNKVLALNPDRANVYYLIAVALSRLNRMDDALQASLHYLQLAPNGDYAKEMQSLIMAAKLTHSGGITFTRTPLDTQN